MRGLSALRSELAPAERTPSPGERGAWSGHLPARLMRSALGRSLAGIGARLGPVAGITVRSALVAVSATATLAVLAASGWDASLVSWLVGITFALAALLLPAWPALAVIVGVGDAVLVPVVGEPPAADRAITLAVELGVAALFALAVRSMMDALRRERLAVAERDADLAAVHEAGQRLAEPRTSEALCLEVARSAARLTGASFGRLVLTTPGRGRILLMAASGPDGETLARGERAAALEVGASRGLAIEADAPVRIGPDRPMAAALPAWYPVSSTFLAVPIVIDGETRGELVAAEKRGRAGFTPVCELLLAIYAAEASATLKSALLSEAVDEVLEAATAERTRSGLVSERGDAVLDIARRLTETFDRTTILGTIVRELNHHLACDAATIRVMAGDELRVAAWAGMTDSEAASLPVLRPDERWFAEVVRSGGTWTSHPAGPGPAHGDPDLRHGDGLAAGSPWRADLVAPLVHGGSVIGTISAVARTSRRWTADDEDFVRALAAHASIAIHNAELFARTEGLTRELRGLVDMSSDLARSLDSAQVADRMARHLATALDVPACRISYWDRDGDRLVPLGHFPDAGAWVPRGMDDDGPPPAVDAAVRRALRDQVAVPVDLPRSAPGSTGPDARLTVLPLVAKGQPIGVVELRSVGREGLRDGQLELGRTMANEAAMALENARLYEEARNQADRDQLTGFFNHRFLHERLGEEIVRAQRSRSALGLLMIDVDDFKLVNDTFGHLFGDRVLQWAAEVIRSTLRLSDVPARYGGDEFAILLPDADGVAAERVAERISATFAARSFEWEGRGPLPIAVSIGAAAFPADARSGQQLIAAADRALYRNKAGVAAEAPVRRTRGRVARRAAKGTASGPAAGAAHAPATR